MVIHTRGDRIRRLRVVAAAADPLALRFRIERALSGGALRPSGVPAQAVVCVKRMRVAMPARSDAWPARLDRELERLVARGVRPFREPVPAGADVVVFADEAELLACLARDWWRGDGGAWWWHGLLNAAVCETIVVRTFAAAITAVPAAIERLAGARLAVPILNALSTASCDELAALVALAFAVPGWTVAPPPPGERADAPNTLAPARALASNNVDRLNGALAVQRQRDVSSLTTPQRALLALALVLRRDPALGRTPGIARLVREYAWVHGMAQPAGRSDDRSADDVELTVDAASVPAIEERDVEIHPLSAGDAQIGAADGQDARRAALDADTARRVKQPSATDADLRARPVGATRTAPDAAARIEASASMVDAGVRHDTSIHSEFAGVAYLVNLALHLEWYGDFMQPARRGLDLPLGDFLALVGAHVCGAPFMADPAWTLLAQLAGRAADDPPAAGVAAPDRMTLAQWVDALVVMLESAAAPALDVDEGGALPFLCRRPGRVAISATRVDVVFPLAEHPLAIRIAGLDRNPGWVPAAGRVFEWHYE